jgi:competence protein ComEA
MYTRGVRFIWLLTLAVSLASVAAWPTPQNQDSSPASTKTKHSKKDKRTSEASDQNASGKTSSKLDLNSATKEQLEAPPGIGEAFAQKIIDGRPYKSKGDLVRKSVLPSSTYDKIKNQVTARQTGKSEGSEEASAGSAAASTAKPSPAQASTATKRVAETPQTTAQTPPEKGMVWVNLNSGVYHREGDRWYGKTKNGKFMSETDAQKAGYRASKTGSKKDAEKEQ